MRRTAMAAIAASGLALTAATAEETPTRQYAPADSTFSIIAVEKDTGLLGLGVQSKALSIGNRVVTGKGGVAIVAHQSSSNPMYGKLVIDGIERGMTPQQALEFALRADKEPDRRQVAVIDIQGRSAAETSKLLRMSVPGVYLACYRIRRLIKKEALKIDEGKI